MNDEFTLLHSAQRSAGENGADRSNLTARGVVVLVNITDIPDGTTLTVTIEGKDPASGQYWTLLQSAALGLAGLTPLRIFPGATAAANLNANGFLPRTWRVVTAHGGETPGPITYSVAASYGG